MRKGGCHKPRRDSVDTTPLTKPEMMRLRNNAPPMFCWPKGDHNWRAPKFCSIKARTAATAPKSNASKKSVRVTGTGSMAATALDESGTSGLDIEG
jgi:hypothetical protein